MSLKRGRYALTKDGNITWCTASEENIGKGRCNHIDHQKKNEKTTDFINKINIKQKPNQEKRINDFYTNFETFDWLELNYPYESKNALYNFNNYYSHVCYMERKITYMTKIELPYLSNKEERENYYEQIHNLELKRVNLHNKVMDSVRNLNDLSSKLNVEPFINNVIIDGNRDKIAEAIFDFCKIKNEVKIKYWF